jgi:hypothetical protein
LSSFSFGGEVTDNVVAFIFSHTLIEQLDISYSKNHIGAILSNLPHLTSLTIDPFEELYEQAHIKLSNLRTLAVYDLWYKKLSLGLFEFLVQSRILPSKTADGKENQETKMSTSLTILVEDEGEPARLSDFEWGRSHLVSTASMTAEKIDRWDGVWYSYTFVWPKNS